MGSIAMGDIPMGDTPMGNSHVGKNIDHIKEGERKRWE